MRLLRFASLWCGLASSQQPPPGALPGFKMAEEFSFRAPFTDVNPFTGARQINNWDLGGTAVAHRSFVRLTTEAQGSKGWLLSQQPLTLPEWSAMLELRASGASANLYGDGLAIWLVKSAEHIEGPVFGRQDKWNGMGLFFDTFQNVDHSHHHKHPYIYVMMNDGTKLYVPDAEKPNPANQVVPGSVDNSGCSYEFRYAENREDVTVLNHTRVHLVYRNRQLKVRLQQTSPGLNKEWFQCIDMKDVDGERRPPRASPSHLALAPRPRTSPSHLTLAGSWRGSPACAVRGRNAVPRALAWAMRAVGDCPCVAMHAPLSILPKLSQAVPSCPKLSQAVPSCPKLSQAAPSSRRRPSPRALHAHDARTHARRCVRSLWIAAVPSPGYFGISAATGDLVDNHDIVQFIVRPTAGIADPDADHDSWANAEVRQDRRPR